MRISAALLLLTMGGLLTAAHGQAPLFWRDPATGLTWASADNGIGVSAAQAAYYCRTLSLAGHKNWRLPDIEELQKLFGGPPDGNGRHVIGPVKITGWTWSVTPGQHPGEQWSLDFGDGGRASAFMGDSGLNRALCVRGKSSVLNSLSK
jgi:hypothetical protein